MSVEIKELHDCYGIIPLNPEKVAPNICSICLQKDDSHYVKCPHCDHIFHLSCLKTWSSFSQIGEGIFNCSFCFKPLTFNNLMFDEKNRFFEKYSWFIED